MGLKKCQRIKLQSDFDQFRMGTALKNRSCENAPGFICKVKENKSNHLPRFAVIVGKKVGKAHKRNKIKRLFREIFRQEQYRLNPQWDYLVIVHWDKNFDYFNLKKKFLDMCASPKPFLSIAIDGTAASGKSSAASALAKKYHLLNVNTGHHYRALAFFLLKMNITPDDKDEIINALENFTLDTLLDETNSRMIINGFSIAEDELRSERVNKQVALFAQVPEIRRKLRKYQRGLINVAKKFNFSGIVMEGRDMTTHVLPEADVRVFLTADPKIREDRRRNEGETDSVTQRDSLDHLRCEALFIDTTRHTLEQVVALIEELIPHRYTSYTSNSPRP
ncbi:MAG: ribonuclease P protein component [Puniceicoccales bacterium]|jgi:cytidylate kinase|nr:ribonuclease P protein component [Puniceicoccales bacterium]